LQLQQSTSLIKTVTNKINSFQIVSYNSCTEQLSSFNHFAKKRASRPLVIVSNKSRWIQVCVQNVSYAYSIFRKIRTSYVRVANVFYFSVRVSSSLAWTVKISDESD